MTLLIPVLLSFFLGPGFGQLYNKEYRKGLYLIGLSLLVLVAAGVWYFRALQPHLPPDISTIDPKSLEPLLKKASAEVSEAHGRTFTTYQLLLFIIWLYGVVDAYFGAVKRRVPAQQNS